MTRRLQDQLIVDGSVRVSASTLSLFQRENLWFQTSKYISFILESDRPRHRPVSQLYYRKYTVKPFNESTCSESIRAIDIL